MVTDPPWPVPTTHQCDVLFMRETRESLFTGMNRYWSSMNIPYNLPVWCPLCEGNKRQLVHWNKWSLTLQELSLQLACVMLSMREKQGTVFPLEWMVTDPQWPVPTTRQCDVLYMRETRDSLSNGLNGHWSSMTCAYNSLVWCSLCDRNKTCSLYWVVIDLPWSVPTHFWSQFASNLTNCL